MSDKSKLTEDDCKNLRTYYEQVMKRMLHEYDQRDRDFRMLITINAAIFAAVGFVLQLVKVEAPGSWIVAGVAVALIAFFGTRAAKALQESVQSFSNWQDVLQKKLAEIEGSILPSGSIGIYQEVDRIKNDKEKKWLDVIESRKAMGTVLFAGWWSLCMLACFFVCAGVVAETYSKCFDLLKRFWQ